MKQFIILALFLTFILFLFSACSQNQAGQAAAPFKQQAPVNPEYCNDPDSNDPDGGIGNRSTVDGFNGTDSYKFTDRCDTNGNVIEFECVQGFNYNAESIDCLDTYGPGWECRNGGCANID